MKPLPLLLFSSLVLFCSCNKKPVTKPNSSSIVAVINGKSESFNLKDSVLFVKSNEIDIVGINSVNGDKIHLFTINNGIVTGNYNDTVSGIVPHYAGIAYYPANRPDSSYGSFYFPPKFDFPCIITISSFTGNNIKGTFNATIVGADNPSGYVSDSTKFKTVTVGVFNVFY